MEGHGQPEGQWGSVSMLLAALDNPAGAAGEALRPRPLLGHPAPAPKQIAKPIVSLHRHYPDPASSHHFLLGLLH